MKIVSAMCLAAGLLLSCVSVDLTRLVADQMMNKNASASQNDSQSSNAKSSNVKPSTPKDDRDSDASMKEPQEYDSPAAKNLSKENLSQYQSISPSGKSYPAGAALSRETFSSIKPGEWASYRVFENQKLQSVIKMALVDRKGSTWTYEWVNVSDEGITAMQMTVENFDSVVKTGTSDAAKVTSIKVMDKNGRVKVLNDAVLNMTGDMYKNLLTSNSVNTSASFAPGGPVSVAAGTFAQTWRVESKVAKRNGSEKGIAYVSSVVPLYHLVKSSSDNGKFSMELLDFGTSGYKSVF